MSTPKRKRYDFVRALWSEHKTLAYRKRILRKLVREAVIEAYGPFKDESEMSEPERQFATQARAGIKIDADRIARELVP